MKKLIYFSIAFLFVVLSCKKDDDSPETKYAILTEDDMEEISSDATELNSLVNQTVMSYYYDAIMAGYDVEYPDMPEEPDSKSTSNTNPGDFEWSGPDLNGWYTRRWESYGYEVTERVRCNDTIVDYEYITSYDGADGYYESVNKTQYQKYERNGKTLYKGYWDWTIENSGYNDISSVHWKMTFDKWDPESGAGSFDWWWGAQSDGGGGYEPFARYLSITATDAGDEWLNIRVTLYDGNTEVWEYEYESPWSPVEMPDLHSCGVN